jgi:tetratricopeptide (TPR) repeat protein
MSASHGHPAEHPFVDHDAIREGMAALRSQRADQAERIVRTLLVRQPNHPAALHILGLSLLMRQHAAEAIAPLQQAAAASSDPIMETHCAVALRASGRLPEALTWLERATARQPPHVPAFLEHGLVLAGLQRYDEAEAALLRGLGFNPAATELVVELGGIYICRAEPAKAKTAFARALALSPGHPRALQGTGTALLFEGDLERAAECFRQLLVQQADHVRAQLDLAHCLLELDRWEEGVGILRQLLASSPAHFGVALRVLISAGRGKFWLRPSTAAAVLRPPPSFAKTAGRVA